MKENLSSILEDRETETRRLRTNFERSLSGKDSQIRSLQADVESLNSQLNDRMKQISVLQEAGKLKDQHIQLLKKVVSF